MGKNAQSLRPYLTFHTNKEVDGMLLQGSAFERENLKNFNVNYQMIHLKSYNSKRGQRMLLPPPVYLALYLNVSEAFKS